MMLSRIATALAVAVILVTGASLSEPKLVAASERAQLNTAAEQTLKQLYDRNDVARQFGRRAKGILVFPDITKGGIGIGGSYGEGTLFVDGRPVGYYSIGSGSVGLTLGAQAFSQVIMFMTDEALQKFRASSGWEAGVDGSVVWIDEGLARSYDTTKSPDPVVGFVFGQQGLMVDASVKGAKYTPIQR